MDIQYKNIIDNIEEVFNKFFINKQIKQIAQISQIAQVAQVAVAVSGGSDSLALLFALNDFCQKNDIKIVALSVDHKMRANSTQEVQKVQDLLKKFNIKHHILSILPDEVPHKNIESNLRQLRYDLLINFCKNNNIEWLFVGHHLGDIAENFLIRLLRGSGLDGLSPIKEIIDNQGIKIVRPFLNINKEELQYFLQSKNITWFEDESNQDEKFLRNKIRKFLASFPDKNIIEKRIVNASQEIAKTRDIFDEMMREEEAKIIHNYGDYYLIDRTKLLETKPQIAHKILALLLMKIAHKKYKPRKEKLLRFYQYLCADEKIKKREFYGCVAENYNDLMVKIYKKL